MLIKELKEIIKDLPDDADLLMQKKVTLEKTILAPVISARITTTADNKHKRLVLMNMKVVKRRKDK